MYDYVSSIITGYICCFILFSILSVHVVCILCIVCICAAWFSNPPLPFSVVLVDEASPGQPQQAEQQQAEQLGTTTEPGPADRPLSPAAVAELPAPGSGAAEEADVVEVGQAVAAALTPCKYLVFVTDTPNSWAAFQVD